MVLAAPAAVAQHSGGLNPDVTSIRFAGHPGTHGPGEPLSQSHPSLLLALQPEALGTPDPLPAPAAIGTYSLQPTTTYALPTQPCQVGHYPCYEREYSSSPFIARIQHRWHTQTKPRLQASHWGYPEYFDERPFGTYVLQAEQMQVLNGLRDQQVLYRYDFAQEGDLALLSPRGQHQLKKIIDRMVVVPGPIVIESTVGDADLDDARRQHVLEALQAAGLPAHPEMVVVDRPSLPGLQGLEAMIIHQNLLQQTQSRGSFSGGGSGTQFSGGTQFGSGPQ